MARFATGKYAKAVCDICGFECAYSELRPQISNGRQTALRVCCDCVDRDSRQPRGKAADPQALRNARPDPSLERSRWILHWRPVDSFPLTLTLGTFEVLAN